MSSKACVELLYNSYALNLACLNEVTGSSTEFCTTLLSVHLSWSCFPAVALLSHSVLTPAE